MARARDWRHWCTLKSFGWVENRNSTHLSSAALNTALLLGCMLDPKWMQVHSDDDATIQTMPNRHRPRVPNALYHLVVVAPDVLVDSWSLRKVLIDRAWLPLSPLPPDGHRTTTLRSETYLACWEKDQPRASRVLEKARVLVSSAVPTVILLTDTIQISFEWYHWVLKVILKTPTSRTRKPSPKSWTLRFCFFFWRSCNERCQWKWRVHGKQQSKCG